MSHTLSPQITAHTDALMERYPVLVSVKQSILDAYRIMESCYQHQGKLLIAGNGGSAADSEHIVGELMKKFKLPRPVPAELAQQMQQIDPARGEWLAARLEQALPALSLVNHPALSTAYNNDVAGVGVFAQQVYGFGRAGDVLVAITTSGNSHNVLYACVVAKALGMKVVGLTGAGGGELAKLADVTVQVPLTETYQIQELHLPIYHSWCLMLEEKFFGTSHALSAQDF